MKPNFIFATSVSAALIAMSSVQPVAASDFKFYSAGGCAPYTTGTPNYNELRFRSDGVQNQSDGYRYVICPVVRDMQSSWGFNSGETGGVVLYFRTNTAGSFQCTLTGGSTSGGSYSITNSTSGNPGDNLIISFSGVDFYNNGATDAPVSIVCRLPPKGTLAKYSVNESGVTDSYAPAPAP
jgi:hypothetical protein